MQKLLLSTILITTSLFSVNVVVPDDYLISDDENITYLYPKEYENLMPQWKEYQQEVIEGYEKQFGYKLDDELRVGIASSNNQIANGFSTQFPFNSQLFYGGGAGYIDYFCFSSWLKTLIIHETAHNFQLNAKENKISKISHKILGNNYFSMFGLFPVFPVPNIMESSFLFEGNAVMNESRYGNGGRLFSGYALAELVSLAKAGGITPELMYNQTLSFPYAENFYLVGGFFQQFLVDRYGLERVNSYFKTYSTQLFPFYSNRIFKKQYGKDFKTLLAEFVEMILFRYKDFVVTEGKMLSQSQIFSPLNVDNGEIYTLVSDKKSPNKLLIFNKEKRELSYKKGSWRRGEVFKKDNLYYTQTSAKISPTKISMGLFDRDGFILDETESKIIQGYKDNGEMVYFDFLSSIENPQVYVDGKFYTEAHSSVYVNNNNLYYFKQEGEKRILYKNREILFEYEGHYGFIVDVSDSGEVYFIASSEYGSSVYKIANGNVKRVTKGDDIIEFKLLSEKEAFVITVGAEGYRYLLINLENFSNDKPYVRKIANNSKQKLTYSPNSLRSSKSLNSKEYNPLMELEYSSLDQSLAFDSDNGVAIDLQANFSDPLTQNSLSAIVSHNDERTIGGLTYENSAYPVEFGGAVYGVNKDETVNDLREYGVDAYLHVPFLATGYWRGSSSLEYTKSYDNLHREPLTLSFDISNKKQFGISKYPNELNALSLFLSSDRSSTILGADYRWEQGLPWQSYIGFNGAYLISDEVNDVSEKGVELSDTFSTLQSDRATVNLSSLDDTLYAKEVKKGEISLKKVFDASLYSYSFPISLQRESIYLKQRLYDVDFRDDFTKQYNETVLGVEADLLFLHRVPLPFDIEYIYSPDVEDKSQVRFTFGTQF